MTCHANVVSIEKDFGKLSVVSRVIAIHLVSMSTTYLDNHRTYNSVTSSSTMSIRMVNMYSRYRYVFTY